MPAKAHETRLAEAPVDISGTSIEDFENKLDTLLKGRPGVIVLDCSKLEHPNSSHIKVLWWAYQRCAAEGVSIHLASPSLNLRRVLKALDLYHIFLGVSDDDVVKTQQIYIEPMSGEYSDEFSANAKSIDAALGKFMSFLLSLHPVSLHLPELILFEIRVMFYEIATNIQNHGFFDHCGTIKFSAVSNESSVVMTFVDSGKAFDPTSSMADVNLKVSAHNKQLRGFGIALIRKIADKMSYNRTDDATNVLRVEKYWKR
jgi:anti-sigma regulatory factor (Ser/Thr protein kinase)/anti-anti-sigma regulatory factor